MMLSEKVRPKQIALLIGNEQQRLQLMKWLKNWKIGSKAVLLTGPPGVGKSTSVYATASELGYSIVEYNASDVRTKTKLTGALSGALQNTSLYGEEEKMMIFLDEVDGLSGRADYAGIEFILAFIENATIPVAMAANVEDDPKLRKLTQKSQMIRFGPVDEDLILIFLKSVAKREGIPASEKALRQISSSCKGDVRFALNMLQTILGDNLINFQIDKQFFSDASALDAILSSVSLEEAVQKLRQYDASPMDKVRSIFDCVVSSKNLSDEERAQSLKMVAEADILIRQINKNQRWRLLRYLDRYLALAILSKKLKRTDSSIPWNLRLSIWNDGRVTKEFLSDLPGTFHVGKDTFAVFYLPYFAFYFRNRAEELSNFLRSYEYSDSEKRVMLKIATKF
ncbi:MAG: AAA family ATPase [archaeon]|nr:AAA family ATPase [archaeon]